MYAERELLPHLKGFKKVGFASYISLAAPHARDTVEKYMEHPAVRMIGVIDESGEIDIDILAETLRNNMEGRIALEIPMIGKFMICREDIDKLRG